MSESNESQNPLDLDLRTRIAAAIYKGCDNRVSPGLSRQAADVVIREMGLDAVISLARDWHNDYDATPAHDPRNPSEADIAYDDAGFQILHTLGFITDHGNCFNCGGADR